MPLLPFCVPPVLLNDFPTPATSLLLVSWLYCYLMLGGLAPVWEEAG